MVQAGHRLIGDWNADTRDEIGVYQNGNWYLDYDGSGVWSAGDRRLLALSTTGWITGCREMELKKQ